MALYQRQGKWIAVAGRLHGSDHTLVHTSWSQQRKQVSARRCVPAAVWVTDCLSIQTAHSTNGSLSLSRSGPPHKGTTQVCVREVITAFHAPPTPPLHSHTNPRLLTLRNSEITQTHKNNTTRVHTGSMGKFLTTCKRKKGAPPLGGKNELFPESAWKRFQNTLSLNNNEYTHINLLLVGELVWRNLHTVCKFNFWPNICNSGLGDVFDFFLQKASQLCRHACVYLAVQLLHGYQVQGLEWMAGRGNEIQAGVESRVVVVVQGALDFQLLLQVAFKLPVDVVHHRLVAARQTNRVCTQF